MLNPLKVKNLLVGDLRAQFSGRTLRRTWPCDRLCVYAFVGVVLQGNHKEDQFCGAPLF